MPLRSPDISNSRISKVIKTQIIAQGDFKYLWDQAFALQLHSPCSCPKSELLQKHPHWVFLPPGHPPQILCFFHPQTTLESEDDQHLSDHPPAAAPASQPSFGELLVTDLSHIPGPSHISPAGLSTESLLQPERGLLCR